MAIDGAALLVVDPDGASAERLAERLRAQGAHTSISNNGAAALQLLEARPVDVVLTELALPDMTGLTLLELLAQRWPGLPVIVVAHGASVADAVSALKAGAADFLEKPLHPDAIAFVASKALARVSRAAQRPPPPPSDMRVQILGESSAMQRAQAILSRAAEGNSTVLIRGESGTGKELVARAIHDASPRLAAPFVKIDCAALPENLMESELFGYEKGAFTGAVSRKPGRVELADRGTLFLDEIGELGLNLQAKLLRLLQDRQLERLGGSKPVSVDVRIVAATHRDLEGMIDRGQFRLDLFYRLNVVPLWLPPLRARRDDIELLALHFARAAARANGRADVRLDAAALRTLRGQRWPGNVRQLQNFIERLVVLSQAPLITREQVESELSCQVSFHTESTAGGGLAAGLGAAEQQSAVPQSAGFSTILPLDDSMRAAEKRALQQALQHCSGNRSQAARLLGVSRSTLYTKLHEHGLSD
jgi:two-component system response regulator AtoC